MLMLLLAGIGWLRRSECESRHLSLSLSLFKAEKKRNQTAGTLRGLKERDSPSGRKLATTLRLAMKWPSLEVLVKLALLSAPWMQQSQAGQGSQQPESAQRAQSFLQQVISPREDSQDACKVRFPPMVIAKRRVASNFYLDSFRCASASALTAHWTNPRCLLRLRLDRISQRTRVP